MNSRRNFMKLGALALVGGFALTAAASILGQEKNRLFPIPPAATQDAAYYFDQKNFEPLVDSDFQIGDSNNLRSATVRLVEVVDNKRDENAQLGMIGASFTLIFESRSRKPLPEQIYSISHPALGEFSLFVSTVGRSGKRYQAVINRINQ